MNKDLRQALRRAALFLRQSDAARPAWTSFKQGTLLGHPSDTPPHSVWLNSRYQVERRDDVYDGQPFVWLSIKGLEKDTRHDWRDLQRIKNEIVGEEWEAVELYPAESRLVDGANQFHLWCVPWRFPFGFGARLVTEQTKDSHATQRPFDANARPVDCKLVRTVAKVKKS